MGGDGLARVRGKASDLTPEILDVLAGANRGVPRYRETTPLRLPIPPPYGNLSKVKSGVIEVRSHPRDWHEGGHADVCRKTNA